MLLPHNLNDALFMGFWLTPTWWPVIRLFIVAPLRAGKDRARWFCLFFYALGIGVAASGWITLYIWKIPSGAWVIPFHIASWLPLLLALSVDPMLVKTSED